MIERYETANMRAIWSEEAIFDRWLRVELAAVAVQHERGLLSEAEWQEIQQKASYQSVAYVRKLEETTHHDVVAFVQAVSASIGSPAARYVHLGLTSSDILDTALSLGIQESLEVIKKSLAKLQAVLKKQALKYKTTLCIGRTHGMHAEPITFGLRLAGWFTEVSRHVARLERVQSELAYGKLSGAVGTFSQTDPEFEKRVLEHLQLKPEAIATQVIPRDRHADLLAMLALLGSGLERFAVEIRSLQRTDIREVAEPFTAGQTGSSAMPHKQNPIISERITGLARLLRGYLVSAYENVALWHDRDISHSAVERVIIPDAFHLLDYMLLKFTAVIENLGVFERQMRHNLERTKGLIFSQNVLQLLIKKGLSREEAYKVVQRAALKVLAEQENDLQMALLKEEQVLKYLQPEQLASAFTLEPYLQHLETLFKRAGIV